MPGVINFIFMFKINLKNLIITEIIILLLLYPFFLVYKNFFYIGLLSSFFIGILNILILLINYFSKKKFYLIFIIPLIGTLVSGVMYFFELSLFDKVDLNQPLTIQDNFISSVFFIHAITITLLSIFSLFQKEISNK